MRYSVTNLGLGESSVGILRIEKPALLDNTVFTLLTDILSTLFFGSLSFKEPIDLGNANFGIE